MVQRLAFRADAATARPALIGSGALMPGARRAVLVASKLLIVKKYDN